MRQRAQPLGSPPRAQAQQRKPRKRSRATADAVTSELPALTSAPSEELPPSALRKRKRKQEPALVPSDAPLRPIRPVLSDPPPTVLVPVPLIAPVPALGDDAVWLPMHMAMSLLPSAYPVLPFSDTVVALLLPPLLPAPPTPLPLDPATLTSLAVSTLTSLSVAAFMTQSGKTSPATKEKHKRLNAAKRRDQCRKNQARYRMRLRDQELELENQLTALNQQIKTLKQRAEQLRSKSDSTNGTNTTCTTKPISESPSDAVLITLEERRSPMEIVTEYFRQFKYGLRLESDRYMLRDELPQYRLHMRRQIAFLYSVVHPDLHLSDLVGVDALVDQWRKYSRYFNDLQLELTKAVVVEDEIDKPPSASDDNKAHQLRQKEIILATATLTVIFSDETIRGVFLHLERNERIKEQLIDKRVSFDFVHTFGFSSVDGEAPKVQYLNCFVDFVKAMLALVEDVNDVVVVL